MSERVIVNILIGLVWGFLCYQAYKWGKWVGARDAEQEGIERLKRCSAGWIAEMQRISAILRAAGLDPVALGIEQAPTDVRSYALPEYGVTTPGGIEPITTLVAGEEIPREEGT